MCELTALAAEKLARDERAARLQALEDCRFYDRLRPRVEERLAAIREGVVPPGKETPERFPGEERLAELMLHKSDLANAAFTVINFANRHDRLRYLRGGPAGGGANGNNDRDALLRETLERGGVYNDRNFFIEVIK